MLYVTKNAQSNCITAVIGVTLSMAVFFLGGGGEGGGGGKGAIRSPESG